MSPCQAGLQKCTTSHQWNPLCEGEKGPIKEICDGLDNNCDGKVDNDLTPPLCNKQGGICAKSQRRCGAEKGWLPCQEANYGVDYEQKETKCDGKDNDCDGVVDPGCLITISGTGSLGYKDDVALVAQYNSPTCLALDKQGNLYICDGQNYRIRKLSVNGIVTTVAGSGKSGDKDGPASSAEFGQPGGLVIDQQGNLIFSDSENHKIKVINLNTNTIQTIAGSGAPGHKDGPALTGELNTPAGLAMGKAGALYIADYKNQRIRKLDANKMLTTIAGDGTVGYKDGQALSAQFNNPQGLVLDSQGNLFIAEVSGNTIRKLDPIGIVTTVAGSQQSGFMDGPSLSARFSGPTGITIDLSGNLYVSELTNARVRKIDPQGNVSTIIGTGSFGYTDGPAKSAQLGVVFALTADKNHNLYLSNLSNHVIRKYIQP